MSVHYFHMILWSAVCCRMVPCDTMLCSTVCKLITHDDTHSPVTLCCLQAVSP